MEKTLVVVQPEGVQKKVIGKIIQRFEQRGFRLVEMGLVMPTRALLEAYQEDQKENPNQLNMISKKFSAPAVPMVFEGENIISISQKMMGDINSIGSIHGDFKVAPEKNIFYCSKNASSVKKDIEIWFPSDKEKRQKKTTTEPKKVQFKEEKWDLEKILLQSLVGISGIVTAVAGFLLIKKRFLK